jgi:hypothetical protein
MPCSYLVEAKVGFISHRVRDFIYNNYGPLFVTGENNTRKPGRNLGTVAYCEENSSQSVQLLFSQYAY